MPSRCGSSDDGQACERGKAYYMISAVSRSTTSTRRRCACTSVKPVEAVANRGNTRSIGRGPRSARDDPDVDARFGRDLAGVEIILNLRRKIEQMQGEVNQFHGLRHIASSPACIDDWSSGWDGAGHRRQQTSCGAHRRHPPRLRVRDRGSESQAQDAELVASPLVTGRLRRPTSGPSFSHASRY